jgi:ribosomal protein L37AE/L43A
MKAAMKFTGKFNVVNGQMVHSKSKNGFNHNCAFCGKRAFHRFQATKGRTHKIWLCTTHMVQFFHLKPNRMAPKEKVKPAPMLDCMPRDYALRRTIEAPMEFFGKKMICFDAGEFMNLQYFFTVYSVIKGREISAPMAFSVTAVLSPKSGIKNKIALHFVTELYPETMQHQIEEAIKFMTADRRCHPSNATGLNVYLTDMGTKFYEEWLKVEAAERG